MSQEITRPELQSEGIIQAWRKAARADMTTILLPEAVKTLATVMRDPMSKDSARVAAARTVLEYSLGHIDDASQKKDLHELSYPEIQEMIEALKEERQTRVIEATVIPEETIKIEVVPIKRQSWFE